METIIETIPGQRVCEYLLVLAPHEELWNRIMKLKEDFATRYETEHARWGKPHITLVNFLQYEKNEAGVIGSLKRIAMGLGPFKIELKNFGSYPKDIIFVNVDSKLPVQNLVNEIRSECDQMMHLNDEIKPYFLDDPNINIARN